MWDKFIPANSIEVELPINLWMVVWSEKDETYMGFGTVTIGEYHIVLKTVVYKHDISRSRYKIVIPKNRILCRTQISNKVRKRMDASDFLFRKD